MAVITISRQYGSLGDEIAAQVCATLPGYRYFDKEMMAQVAAGVGLRPDGIVDFSEDHYEVGSFLKRLFGRERTVAEVATWHEDASGAKAMEVAQLDEASCIRMVEGLIHLVYRQGRIVIVGRGGQAILQQMPGVLHVRCEAPLTTRVHRIQHRENISVRAAERTVGERDRAAAVYLKRFYGIEWSDSMLYHLVINTGKLDVNVASQLIVDTANSIREQP
jgi:cytidylate kinase